MTQHGNDWHSMKWLAEHEVPDTTQKWLTQDKTIGLNMEWLMKYIK
jgi:hypothetical protein